MSAPLTYTVWQYTRLAPRRWLAPAVTLEEALAAVDQALANPDVYEVHLICMKKVPA